MFRHHKCTNPPCTLFTLFTLRVRGFVFPCWPIVGVFHTDLKNFCYQPWDSHFYAMHLFPIGNVHSFIWQASKQLGYMSIKYAMLSLFMPCVPIMLRESLFCVQGGLSPSFLGTPLPPPSRVHLCVIGRNFLLDNGNCIRKTVVT